MMIPPKKTPKTHIHIMKTFSYFVVHSGAALCCPGVLHLANSPLLFQF